MTKNENINELNKLKTMLFKDKVLALDIGSNSVKAMDVVKKGNEVQINAFLEVDNVEKFFDGKDITNPDGLVKGIVQVMKMTGMRANKTDLIYNSSNMQTKIVRVPDMSDKEIKEYVDIEYHKSFSNVSLHTHIMDYHQFGLIREDDRADQSVLIATVPIVESTKLMTSFGNKNVNVRSIETNINALANALILAENKADHKLILHLGKEYSLILFMKGKTPIFYRMFSFGYDSLTRKLQDDFQTSLGNVESLVKSKGFGSRQVFKTDIDVEAFDFSMREEFGNFVTEVYRSLNYVKMQTKFEAEKIYLSGGLANMTNIEEFVEENVLLPAEIWKFSSRDVNGVNVIIKGQENIGPEYALVLGVSVRGWV